MLVPLILTLEIMRMGGNNTGGVRGGQSLGAGDSILEIGSGKELFS